MIIDSRGSGLDTIGAPPTGNGVEAGGEGVVDVSLGKRFLNYKTLLSFAVAFVIIVLAFSKINVDPVDIWNHIRYANVWLYVLAFVVYYCSFPVRALRWRLLLQNVGYTEKNGLSVPPLAGLMEIIFISWFANCIVPAKLGDAMRGYLLKRRVNVSFSRTMGTVLAERIIDMLVLFVFMGLAGLAIFRGHLPGLIVNLFVIGAVLAVAVVLALVLMKRFGRLVERLLPHRLRHFYSHFEQGTLQSFRNVPLLFALTIIVWTIEGARLWLILAALGLWNVNPLIVVFTSLAASLLTTVPFTPAGLGLVESGVITILLFMNSIGQVQGVTEGLAGSVAILDSTINRWSLVFIGAIVYLRPRLRSLLRKK